MGYITAGAVVLLGLGCLAAELTDVAEQCRDAAVDDQIPSIEQEISSGLNAVVDIAAIHTIIVRARLYLDQSRRLLAAQSSNLDESNQRRQQLEGFALRSPIYYALACVQFFKILAGFLTPYSGDSLRRSSAQLTELHDLLDLASPNALWTGAAAEVYQGQVTHLQSLVEKLAHCDQWLAANAQHEAELVLHTRLVLGILEGLLIVAAEVEYSYYVSGDYDGAAIYAQDAAFRSLVVLGILLVALPAGASEKQKTRAQHAFYVYRDAAEERIVGCVLDSPTQAATPETEIAGLEAFFVGMLPLSESEEAPVDPVLTMPKPVDAATPAGRFAGPAGSAYRDLAFANGVAAPSRRPAFKGQPSRRIAEPATADPAVDAIDGEQVGEGTSTAGERAPVEVVEQGPEGGSSPWQI